MSVANHEVESLKKELELQREINKELEQAFHKTLLQSRKDENLITELVIINQILVEAHQKLNAKVSVLKQSLKILKNKIMMSDVSKKEVVPLHREKSRADAKIKENILPQFAARTKIEREVNNTHNSSSPKP